MTTTFLILIVTVLLFVSNRVRPDFVALGSALCLYLFGILEPRQIFAGFGDPTVVMIGALLIVSAALSQSGVIAWMVDRLLQLSGTDEKRVLLVLIVGTGVFSGFLSNTGIIAMLLPAVPLISRKIKISPSKLLLPIAFAANTGGLLTLIGTPPNIVISDALEDAGFEPLGFFEFAYMGVPLLAIFVIYMIFGGSRMTPHRDADSQETNSVPELGDLKDTYSLEGMFFEIQVKDNPKCIGKSLGELGLGKNYRVDIVFIDRYPDNRSRGEKVYFPNRQTILRSNDVLLAKARREDLEKSANALAFSFKPLEQGAELSRRAIDGPVELVEVVITPRSSLIGKTLTGLQVSVRESLQVLALRRGDAVISDLATTPIQCGDLLFIRMGSDLLEAHNNTHGDYLILSHRPAESKAISPKGWLALGALMLMVILMLFRIVPSSIAAVIAACVMILGGVINLEDAYRRMNWESLFLIALMIPMSTALQVTGAAEKIALGLVNVLGQYDPIWLLAGVFLITSVFSQVMSNTATAILVAPIVIKTAEQLSISPYPLFMTVAVAASAAFLTPIATTSNIMVMTPGSYRFSDYLRCGIPLVLIFLLVSMLLIPIIWPFAG